MEHEGPQYQSKTKNPKRKMVRKTPMNNFYTERKILSEVIPHIINKWGRNFKVVVIDGQRYLGGMDITLNDQDIKATNMFIPFRIMTIQFQLIDIKDYNHVSNVYDFNIKNGKPLFLNSISSTSNLYSQYSWIIGSDFNIIKCLEEMKG